MAADALSIIPGAVLRNLSDKLYEKRKNAALEIEGIVKQLPMASEHEKISAVKSLLPTISPTRCEPSEGWVDWPCSSYCRTRAKRWPVKRRRKIIRKGFYQTKNVEHKGQVDLVTDKACEDLIFNHLNWRRHTGSGSTLRGCVVTAPAARVPPAAVVALSLVYGVE
uniref:Uncharacterized protein n=2 Tax=Setaria viridis TaxID=4556 RepID=A0A4U6TV09_SETVI|nr:hypothetical protein SEVIR_7G215500v2 [Setaria viridis]